jgi:hypothetical protein
MSDRFLEQQINIKFCVKIRKEHKLHLRNDLQGLWGRSYEKVKCLECHKRFKESSHI